MSLTVIVGVHVIGCDCVFMSLTVIVCVFVSLAVTVCSCH